MNSIQQRTPSSDKIGRPEVVEGTAFQPDKQSFNRKLSISADFAKPVIERSLVDKNGFHISANDRRQRWSLQDASRPSKDIDSVSSENSTSNNNNKSNKKVSPSSSSMASDSAFSQSQSTLESEESEPSNCFRGSLSDKGNPLFPAEGSEDGTNTVVDSSDQFKIIWHHLTYKLPERRFEKLRSSLRRYKEKLWPDEQSDQLQSSMSSCQIITDADGKKQQVKAPAVGRPRKIIFEDLNGCLESGRLTAILGPSGAGKTTFLKCLTNNLVRGVSGSIDIVEGANNVETTNKSSKNRLKLCIIPQKDYLFDNLTVMENLLFASRIKNTQRDFEHLKNVERVTNLLGLGSCLKLKTSKLSGGQHKRVSIAQELLSNPDILILDEPTSGLDSLTCYRTVSVLRDLVNMSRAGYIAPLAIIMTIHQPQIKVFNLFHHVYIMSSIGQCIYEGRPEYLIDTVADCCKLLPPPDDLNPASFIIDLASEIYGQKPMNQLTKLQRNNFKLMHSDSSSRDELSRSKFTHRIDIYISGDESQTEEPPPPTIPESTDSIGGSDVGVQEDLRGPKLEISDRLKRCNNHSSYFWYHTRLLISRLWLSMWRDPLLTTTRIMFHLLVPFVFYFVYSQKSGEANACPSVHRELDLQTMTSEENLNRLRTQHNELILSFENVSLFFLLLYSFSMCVLAVTALSFPLNMQILLKETSNGWYSMPRFVMAKTLADLPIELSMPMVSVSIAYVLTGQPSSYLNWRLLMITAVMTLCSLISQTLGLLFGAYFMNNVQAAVFVSQASSLPWIMLSGFTTRVTELPAFLRWLSYCSIYRLGIESIVAVRYGFGMCPCDPEVVDHTPTKLIGIPEQLKSIMRYYIETSANATIPGSGDEDIFQRLASTLSRANTYGVEIVTCHDVRPYIMSARGVDEATLPTFLLILVSIFVILRVLLFFVVGFRAYRIG